jgi:CheY-like chemotaxis protein
MLHRLLGEHVHLTTITGEEVGNVKADPGQIEQVILNLAVNARDAMPGGGRLTIETANVRLDNRFAGMADGVVAGDYVMLAVSDIGTGMSSEVLAHIFEPFFTTKEDGKGTGLGLATCHGIVKQSGGHITVYSELGNGTTFKVFLPRVEEAVELVAAPSSTPLAACGGEVILLVEDEAMLRELGTTILEELGYRVYTAGNGCEALELLRDPALPEVNLILTDLIMPEMGGQELIRHVRPLLPRTKVIYSSGYTEDSIIWAGGLETGIHFLPKPYSVVTIAEKVREVLNLPVSPLV